MQDVTHAPLAGFEPRFADFPDYILRITEEIWEGRGVALIRDYYAADTIVRTPGGFTRGVDTVIANTLAAQSEFPDRTLLGEDVIWSGSPAQGLYSSHRIVSTATHAGDGAYGPATGARLTYRVIADCHAQASMINDEWLVRDEGAVVRQLGRDVESFTRDRIRRAGGPDVLSATPPVAPAGPYGGRGNDNAWGARYADLLTRMMAGSFDAIEQGYDRACQVEHPGGLTGHSFAAIAAFWVSLRASFPSAKFEIDHVIGRDDPLFPPRAAIRWRLHGKHDGTGRFGPPSGAPVQIMGIAHAEFGPFGADGTSVRREYVVIDDVAVWQQILLHSGRV